MAAFGLSICRALLRRCRAVCLAPVDRGCAGIQFAVNRWFPARASASVFRLSPAEPEQVWSGQEPAAPAWVVLRQAGRGGASALRPAPLEQRVSRVPRPGARGAESAWRLVLAQLAVAVWREQRLVQQHAELASEQELGWQL